MRFNFCMLFLNLYIYPIELFLKKFSEYFGFPIKVVEFLCEKPIYLVPNLVVWFGTNVWPIVLMKTLFFLTFKPELALLLNWFIAFRLSSLLILNVLLIVIEWFLMLCECISRPYVSLKVFDDSWVLSYSLDDFLFLCESLGDLSDD